MKPRSLCLTAFLLAACCLCATAEPRWSVQYFFDESKRSLALSSIAFPSAQRGLAAGAIIDSGKPKPVVLVTSNGGASWSEIRVDEPGHSLFCLDETACWMATPKGVWFSTETGRNWRKILKRDDILRVYFISRERGWAFGAEKTLLETRDGGKTWTKTAEAEALKTSPDRTVFHDMTFLSPKLGLLAARSEPPTRRGEQPLWLESEPELRREHPTLTVMLETKDGGETWQENAASMFGRLARLTTRSNDGKALGLIEYDRFFQYPAEVYRYSLAGRHLERSLRLKDFAITDVAMTPGGTGFAAGFEAPGAVARTPIPMKVRVLRSTDLSLWVDIPADYRAVARRVMLAVADDRNIWLATDTGMILKLTE